jgi:hypothetical protein
LATGSGYGPVGTLVARGFEAPDPDPRSPKDSSVRPEERSIRWRCTTCRQVFNTDQSLRDHSRALRHDTVIWPEQT